MGRSDGLVSGVADRYVLRVGLDDHPRAEQLLQPVGVKVRALPAGRWFADFLPRARSAAWRLPKLC